MLLALLFTYPQTTGTPLVWLTGPTKSLRVLFSAKLPQFNFYSKKIVALIQTFVGSQSHFPFPCPEEGVTRLSARTYTFQAAGNRDFLSAYIHYDQLAILDISPLPLSERSAELNHISLFTPQKCPLSITGMFPPILPSGINGQNFRWGLFYPCKG
jgi:hypothetical protein